MDIIERIHEEEAEIAFFLREEFGEMDTVATQTTRIIFRCNCKHVWAHDYQLERGHLLRTWAPGAGDTNQHPFSTPEWDKRCPKCGHMNVKASEVIGTTNSKPCDERCLNATSHICNCSCGGKQHGRGHVEVM